MRKLTFRSPRQDLLARRQLLGNLLNRLEVERSNRSFNLILENSSYQLELDEHYWLANASYTQLTLEHNSLCSALSRQTSTTENLDTRSQKTSLPGSAQEDRPSHHTRENSDDMIIPGRIYQGHVFRLKAGFACISLPYGCYGTLQLPEVADQPLGQLYEYLNLGDSISVRVINVDDRGQISLSMRDIPEYHYK
ncbi:S1 RNA-binding domain-containing protein [Pseudomonas fluorescens]|nr:S1 RNA-binding domain-containing protein [Pseudomonas aeruginosa]NKI48651.1 S1 RNA-binding domain-containing protein [Pseudomonas fluorescens]NKI54809.1 S1 RNA-binding domain-containing protein [Pseudomonas fluorescens]NKI63155.1 S1 RNA-binding domain-containing protein [Pseudomonas fluorescens]